jgi:hypothetical protein
MVDTTLLSSRQPAINENVPASNALRDKNPMHVPGVRPQPVPHLCPRAGADNQHGAALVGQGAAKHDESLLDQVVDEGRMLISVRLIARALRMVAV